VPWGIDTNRLSVDARGRVVYRYKQPFRDGSTQVVLEPLDFMFRMNGMPRAQGCAGAAIARLAALVPRPKLNLTRFHGVFAPNFKHRPRIVPHRLRGRVDSDKPTAPMSWMQRLKRVFAIDIETCPDCGGKLRVIACTRDGFTRALLGLRPNRTLVLACAEDPPLIRQILTHIQRREALLKRLARAPPDSQQTPVSMCTQGQPPRAALGQPQRITPSGPVVPARKRPRGPVRDG
jgi:hypothetical protein